MTIGMDKSTSTSRNGRPDPDPGHGHGSGGGSVDDFVDRYEEAQARDGHAELAAYLPGPDHPLYLTVLCELVRVDLEYGWTRGRPRRLEEYRAEFPALFRDPARLREVAFEESRLRRQAGETPAADEYLRRFGIDGLAGSGEGEGEGGDPYGSLRESDPRTAERVADALRMLPEPGSDFAGFRLIRELGRGAFGRVYLARQGDLADRPVALKVSADVFGEPQALAQLQHTHVVPIYSAHQVGPLRAVCMPYFGATTLVDVLRDLQDRGAPPESGAALVDSLTSLRIAVDGVGNHNGGGELAVAADHGPPPAQVSATAALQTLRKLGYVQALLWIGTRLADGLAHAHERGIVHRDLKPANVLLTDEGQPMLLDFNLAADTKGPGGAAVLMIGGTLPYMPPEALDSLRTRTGPRPGPSPALADVRGDIYGLGVILAELLTGRHPFPIRRGPLEEVLPLMVADRAGPPPPLRSWNPSVTPSTESILLRCLDPDPSRRYQDARQLLDDLQRQLDDRPLRHAPEPSPRERAAKWARRHPRLTLGTGLVAAAAMLIAALVAVNQRRERLFGPVEAKLAFRQLVDAHEGARVLLLDPSGDPSRRAEGVAIGREALARYAVLDSPDWPRSPLVRNLPAGEQAELRAAVGELLMFWAGDLGRRAAVADPSRRPALAREALRLSALAESCHGPGEAPRLLWDQRVTLSRLAGDADGAARALARAVAVPLRSLREHALAFLVLDDPARGTIAEALPALAEASRRSPQEYAIWMNLGQCHAALGRHGEAEDCFTIANVLRPTSPWPFFHRGTLALERKEYASARLDFDQALRIRPALVPARVNRALARIGQQDYAGAIEDLTHAMDRGANETRIYFIRAEARSRSGDRAGAEGDRAEGMRRTPDDAASWVVRGLTRLPGDPQGALADFDSALALDPRSRAALQNKATVLAESLGRTAEAVAVLDRAVALYPDFAPARVGRGVLLARLGRPQDARRDAEEARGRDPSSADTAYRAACIYALTSKADPSDRPRALRMLAGALGQEGRWLEVARTDPDLDPLRDQQEFRNLLQAFSGH